MGLLRGALALIACALPLVRGAQRYPVKPGLKRMLAASPTKALKNP